THDTKRSEDVRARLDVLSEMPDLWRRRLKAWTRWNRARKETIDGVPIPRPLGELFYYQTLAGAWPLEPAGREGFRGRIESYAIKAAREAKMETRWTAPHEDYEKALIGFIRRTLEPSKDDAFLRDFSRFASRLAFWGAFNSLGMTLIKVAAPGVPDFYQGTEMWDLSLVDPDNRRPVDFELRRKSLEAVSPPRRGSIRELLRSWPDGRIKMYVTARALAARKAAPDLFLDGDYIPLEARGERAANVIAFARRRGDAWALAVVPRLTSGMTRPGKLAIPDEAWGDTALVLPPGAPRAWRNVLVEGAGAGAASESGEIPVARIFAGLPVALMNGE
ncbi:MAG TPA: malto-oligosyltrehalose synthase, partial [Candidatus Eisenbacteria bacterium]|nr:malto-oligosyltrehalose synthase [Candidatus Eisenbacteria bacterium]